MVSPTQERPESVITDEDANNFSPRAPRRNPTGVYRDVLLENIIDDPTSNNNSNNNSCPDTADVRNSNRTTAPGTDLSPSAHPEARGISDGASEQSRTGVVTTPRNSTEQPDDDDDAATAEPGPPAHAGAPAPAQADPQPAIRL
jgi:hypothetical protein